MIGLCISINTIQLKPYLNACFQLIMNRQFKFSVLCCEHLSSVSRRYWCICYGAPSMSASLSLRFFGDTVSESFWFAESKCAEEGWGKIQYDLVRYVMFQLTGLDGNSAVVVGANAGWDDVERVFIFTSARSTFSKQAVFGCISYFLSIKIINTYIFEIQFGKMQDLPFFIIFSPYFPCFLVFRHGPLLLVALSSSTGFFVTGIIASRWFPVHLDSQKSFELQCKGAEKTCDFVGLHCKHILVFYFLSRISLVFSYASIPQ
jgi:hypothetical protein